MAKRIKPMKNFTHLTFLFSLFLFLERLFICMVDQSVIPQTFLSTFCLLAAVLGPGSKQWDTAGSSGLRDQQESWIRKWVIAATAERGLWWELVNGGPRPELSGKASPGHERQRCPWTHVVCRSDWNHWLPLSWRAAGGGQGPGWEGFARCAEAVPDCSLLVVFCCRTKPPNS